MLPWLLKKHHRVLAPTVVPDPLVDPGNPPHRDQARPAPYPLQPHARMVALAKGTPSSSETGSPQTKNATVMLVDPVAGKHAVGLHVVERDDRECPPIACRRPVWIEHDFRSTRAIQLGAANPSAIGSTPS